MTHQSAINVVSYVEGLDREVRDILFQSPWTCQAVLRSLTPLAKQYVLRLLWIDKPVAKGVWMCGSIQFHVCMGVWDYRMLSCMGHGALKLT